MKAFVLSLCIIFILSCFFSGCIPGGVEFKKDSPAGFFTGIWHCWIAPISLILGFFKPEIRIYEQYNTGWWYDLGFYIALIGGFGGIAVTRKKFQDYKK